MIYKEIGNESHCLSLHHINGPLGMSCGNFQMRLNLLPGVLYLYIFMPISNNSSFYLPAINITVNLANSIVAIRIQAIELVCFF